MTTQQDIKLTLLMSRLIQRIVALDRNEKACHGVTLTQHYTIEALYRKREMSMKQLSIELNLAISTLTRIVDVLVRDGFIIRKPGKTDRRKVMIRLTEKGMDKARQLRECTQRFWMDLLKHIPHQKKPDLGNHVKLILDAMERVEGRCIKSKSLQHDSKSAT